MTVKEIRARIGRLLELAWGFAAEVKRWQDSDSPLLLGEKREYVRGLYDALAGADEARVVLEGGQASCRNVRRGWSGGVRCKRQGPGKPGPLLIPSNPVSPSCP
jgi:hypothetical protein